MSGIFDPLREAEELREQLATDKRRVVFLFGAGTSQAVGMDGIKDLTGKVSAILSGQSKADYERVKSELGPAATVETILDRVRLCRQLIGVSGTQEAGGFKGTAAATLDREICKAIYDRVRIEPAGGIGVHANFAAWLSSVPRAFPVEIYTTNYDLMFERGMEAAEVPYFDGFVGTINPYFSDASVEFDEGNRFAGVEAPRSWTRLWKVHGSIGWRTVTEKFTGTKRVVRLPTTDPGSADEIMIFPSTEKYADSRKLPFVALQDRLRRVISGGECQLVVAGYSFGDEHINEIIFKCLRANNRLAVTVLSFDELDDPNIKSKLIQPTQGARNLTVYTPGAASIGGRSGTWTVPSSPPPNGGTWPFWDDANKRFLLGDFKGFSQFLTEFFGSKTVIPAP